MENNINTRQLNTITPGQANFLRRTKNGLDILSVIFFVLTLGAAMYIIPAVAESEEGVSKLAIGLCQATVALGFLAVTICSVVANRIDWSYGAYYCKKCKQIHYPSKEEVAQSTSFLGHGLLRCPHCKKLSWNKKMIPME